VNTLSGNYSPQNEQAAVERAFEEGGVNITGKFKNY